jgi:dephospho-CoA kinase
MQRNGFTEEAVRAIINAQMSGAERRRRADYLLPNSAGMQELQVNAEKLHQILSNRAQNAG